MTRMWWRPAGAASDKPRNVAAAGAGDVDNRLSGARNKASQGSRSCGRQRKRCAATSHHAPVLVGRTHASSDV